MMINILEPVETESNKQSSEKIRLTLGATERKLLLGVVDVTLICCGTLIALFIWTKLSPQDFAWPLLKNQAIWLIFLNVLWFGWMFINELYEVRYSTQAMHALKRIWMGAFFMGICYLFYFFIINSSVVSSLRLAPILSILLTVLFLSIWRIWYAKSSVGSVSKQRVMIVGAGESGRLLASSLQKHPHYQSVGFIDDCADLHGQSFSGVTVLGSREMLRNSSNEIDRVVFAVSNGADDDLLEILTKCHERGIIITPMPVLYELITGKVAVEHIGSQWYAALPFNRTQFESLHLVSKRLLDLICGLIIGLIFILVFPFVTLAIKLNSSGPIFYRQERVGLHGGKFMVYKFRSMVQDAESDGKAKWSVKGDSRITTVGKFMRKTRIDELPQILNVLCGEMSMVGPRPEREQFIVELQKEIPFYRTRLAAKPGLTGWAQVNYGYGATVEDALIKLQYDLYYLKHRSLWLDLKILLRTFSVVLRMQGQ
jgi:exopolysaccharide biosynthesis polyprenyl glycosylphosphotransferase